MGLQVSRGVYPKVSAAGTLQGATALPGRRILLFGPAERLSGRRGALAARSRAYAAIDSAQIFGTAKRGVYQREECYPHCPDMPGATPKLHGATFLGSWVSGIDGSAG